MPELALHSEIEVKTLHHWIFLRIELRGGLADVDVAHAQVGWSLRSQSCGNGTDLLLIDLEELRHRHVRELADRQLRADGNGRSSRADIEDAREGVLQTGALELNASVADR